MSGARSDDTMPEQEAQPSALRPRNDAAGVPATETQNLDASAASVGTWTAPHAGTDRRTLLPCFSSVITGRRETADSAMGTHGDMAAGLHANGGTAQALGPADGASPMQADDKPTAQLHLQQRMTGLSPLRAGCGAATDEPAAGISPAGAAQHQQHQTPPELTSGPRHHPAGAQAPASSGAVPQASQPPAVAGVGGTAAGSAAPIAPLLARAPPLGPPAAPPALTMDAPSARAGEAPVGAAAGGHSAHDANPRTVGPDAAAHDETLIDRRPLKRAAPPPLALLPTMGPARDAGGGEAAGEAPPDGEAEAGGEDTDTTCEAAKTPQLASDPLVLARSASTAVPASEDGAADAADAGGADGDALYDAASLPAVLPPPVEVTMPIRVYDGRPGTVKPRGANAYYIKGTVCGVFDPALYMQQKDCILCNGLMMSRSKFEQIGGSNMAKWYRSIRVLPDMETLGEWLESRGLPIFKGRPRRCPTRPSAAQHMAIASARPAAAVRASSGEASGGSGGAFDALAARPRIAGGGAAAAAGSPSAGGAGEEPLFRALKRQHTGQPSALAGSLDRLPDVTLPPLPPFGNSVGRLGGAGWPLGHLAAEDEAEEGGGGSRLSLSQHHGGAAARGGGAVAPGELQQHRQRQPPQTVAAQYDGDRDGGGGGRYELDVRRPPLGAAGDADARGVAAVPPPSDPAALVDALASVLAARRQVRQELQQQPHQRGGVQHHEPQALEFDAAMPEHGSGLDGDYTAGQLRQPHGSRAGSSAAQLLRYSHDAGAATPRAGGGGSDYYGSGALHLGDEGPVSARAGAGAGVVRGNGRLPTRQGGVPGVTRGIALGGGADREDAGLGLGVFDLDVGAPMDGVGDGEEEIDHAALQRALRTLGAPTLLLSIQEEQEQLLRRLRLLQRLRQSVLAAEQRNAAGDAAGGPGRGGGGLLGADWRRGEAATGAAGGTRQAHGAYGGASGHSLAEAAAPSGYGAEQGGRRELTSLHAAGLDSRGQYGRTDPAWRARVEPKPEPVQGADIDVAAEGEAGVRTRLLLELWARSRGATGSSSLADAGEVGSLRGLDVATLLAAARGDGGGRGGGGFALPGAGSRAGDLQQWHEGEGDPAIPPRRGGGRGNPWA